MKWEKASQDAKEFLEGVYGTQEDFIKERTSMIEKEDTERKSVWDDVYQEFGNE